MSRREYLASGQPAFTDAVPQGSIRIEYPFGPANPDTRIISQDYIQLVGAITYPTYNSAPPTSVYSGTAYYCHDTPRIPIGGNLCRFTRVWASKPTQMLEYENIVVQYPARAAVYIFDVGTSGGEFDHYPYIAAKAYSLPRRAQIVRDFFLIGNNGFEDYGSPTDIPMLNETVYTAADITGSGSGPFNNAQWDSIRGNSQNIGLFSGAVLTPSDTSNPSSGNVTRVASGLSAGTYDIGQSTLNRWMGNIWERRVTRITL